MTVWLLLTYFHNVYNNYSKIKKKVTAKRDSHWTSRLRKVSQQNLRLHGHSDQNVVMSFGGEIRTTIIRLRLKSIDEVNFTIKLTLSKSG